MSATLIGNNRATRDAFVPPPTLNENGDPMSWRMFFDDGARIADADSLREIIEVLISDYEIAGTEEAKFFLRRNHLKNAQKAARINIAANISAEEWATLTPEEEHALTFEGEDDPDFEMNDGMPFVWSRDYPLVLMRDDYAPYDETNMRPMSSHGDYEQVPNILWLNAETELEFLVGLNDLGVISFGRPRAVNRTPKSLRTSV